MKQCLGCGIKMQYESPGEKAYAVSHEHDYCQSCFRLRHYNDFKHVHSNVNDSDTLSFIESFDGLLVWVLDLMNIEQSMIPSLLRSLVGKKVLILANKRDLLPQSLNNNKLKSAIMRSMKNYPIELFDILFVSAQNRKTLEPFLPYLYEGNLAFIGCVNAGKSSIINTLMGDEQLSVSPVASTTADVICIKKSNFVFYDTPGIQNETEFVHLVDKKDLLRLNPRKKIKPQTFQIYEQQSLSFSNLFTLTIHPEESISVVAYIPGELVRSKPENADRHLELATTYALENPDYRKKLYPKQGYNIDLEIFDLGFIHIKGKYNKLELKYDKRLEVVMRRGVL